MGVVFNKHKLLISNKLREYPLSPYVNHPGSGFNYHLNFIVLLNTQPNMKNLLLLLCWSIFYYPLAAQPTITQSQFPWSLGTMIASHDQTYQAPSEGMNQTWDYTGLDVSAPQNLTMIDPVSSSISGLPASSFCINSSPEECFLVNSSGLQRTGVGGFGSSVPYTDPEFILRFPVVYGDSTVDHFHADSDLGGFNGTRDGDVEIKVVGYGTLQLPNSVTITNAMLVKTHEQYVDTTDFGTLSIVQFNFINYNFYAAGYPWSILLMTTGSAIPGGPISTGKYYITTPINQLETYDISSALEVYPNPVEDRLMIKNLHGLSIHDLTYTIVNMQGEIVTQGNAQDELNINVTALPKGMYMLQIQGDQIYANKRFIKVEG
jgi:hypothetical protein